MLHNLADRIAKTYAEINDRNNASHASAHPPA